MADQFRSVCSFKVNTRTRQVAVRCENESSEREERETALAARFSIPIGWRSVEMLFADYNWSRRARVIGGLGKVNKQRAISFACCESESVAGR